MILVDSNIFIYAYDSNSPFHKRAKDFLEEKSLTLGEICITPQVMLEFFGIVTQKVKKPLSGNAAIAIIDEITSNKNILCVLPGETSFRTALKLAERHNIVGRDIFDLQLITTMLDNDIATLATHNLKDFTKFSEITTIDPLV